MHELRQWGMKIMHQMLRLVGCMSKILLHNSQPWWRFKIRTEVAFGHRNFCPPCQFRLSDRNCQSLATPAFVVLGICRSSIQKNRSNAASNLSLGEDLSKDGSITSCYFDRPRVEEFACTRWLRNSLDIPDLQNCLAVMIIDLLYC